MINLLGIKTPAAPEAKAVMSEYGLQNHGIQNPVSRNEHPESLRPRLMLPEP